MLYFDCYRSVAAKMDKPWRYMQHASEDGFRTLCGRRISIRETWAKGSPEQGQLCERCRKALVAQKATR
jgi:hypothetical protein